MTDPNPREQYPTHPEQPATPTPPPYQQPGYGQTAPQPQANPYGQPAANAYPPQQQNPYGAQNPYPQAPAGQYGQQPGAYPPGYPAGYGQPAYPVPTETPRSGTLGIAALVIVGVCAAIITVVGWSLGAGMGQLFLELGISDPNTLNQDDPRLIAWATQMQPWFTALTVVSVAGFCGWILGIVAVAQRRGKAFGIWAIVLGILAPIVSFIAMILGMMPAIQTLA